MVKWFSSTFGRATVVSGEQRTETASTTTAPQKQSLGTFQRSMPSASAAAPQRKKRKYAGMNSKNWWEPEFCTRVKRTKLNASSTAAMPGRAGAFRLQANTMPATASPKLKTPSRSAW